jgi:hypothetical protein
LREPLAEQMRDIEQQGLNKPRADDAAYFSPSSIANMVFPEVDVR